MIRPLALSVLCATPAAAQEDRFRQLILEQWTAFTAFCTPFIENPAEALAAQPMDLENLVVSHSADGAFREYSQTSQGYGDGKSAYLQTVGDETILNCTTYVSLDAAFGQPLALNEAFVSILDQTNGISYAGGMIEYDRADPLQENLPAIQKVRAAYRLDGVFPGELTVVSAEVSYFLLAFDVSARFDAKEGLR